MCRGVLDGVLLGVLLHQFATWLGSRRQEVRWTKYLVVSSSSQPRLLSSWSLIRVCDMVLLLNSAVVLLGAR